MPFGYDFLPEDATPELREFSVKLSMATIYGRPLSVTLARCGEPDTPLIGCSDGFLALSGLERRDVLGRNCRFLNQDVPLKLREKLRHCIRTGAPFMGVLDNKRHVGSGVFEYFSNLFHLAVIPAGNRKYFLGIQANVTGLDLDLESGNRDAKRLQAMFDSVISSRVHAWVHIQEGALHSLPVYMTIRLDDPTDGEEDQVELLEENALFGGGPAQLCPESPDQYLVLAPKFDTPQDQYSTKGGFKWRTHLLGSSFEVKGNAEVSTPPVQQLAPRVAEKIEDKVLVAHIGEALAHVSTDMDMPLSRPPGLEPPDSCQPTLPKEADAEGLKNHLRALVHEDPKAVLIVRGITKLGQESAEKLQAHFEAIHSPLKAVHVPCVFKKRRGKSDAAKPQEKRVAGRCFIVMHSPEDASTVLALGSEHMVDGVPVMIHSFDLEDTRTS